MSRKPYPIHKNIEIIDLDTQRVVDRGIIKARTFEEVSVKVREILSYYRQEKSNYCGYQVKTLD